MSDGTGAGIHVPELATDVSFQLGDHDDIFQAEVFAIMMGTMVSPDENEEDFHLLG